MYLVFENYLFQREICTLKANLKLDSSQWNGTKDILEPRLVHELSILKVTNIYLVVGYLGLHLLDDI